MSFRYYYRNQDDDLVELVNRIQFGAGDNAGTEGLVMNAEQGSVGGSTVTIDDPTGDLDDLWGFRAFYVTETELAGDDYDGRVYTGYTNKRTFSREREFVATARTIAVELDDINTIFECYIMEGDDANRPAETDVERITWLLTTHEASLIDDSTYFSSASPYNMDKNDYRGQSFASIIDDCSQQSGKNYYLWRPTAGYSLWYAPKGTSAFESSIKISNDPDDIDVSPTDGTGTVFPPAATTELTLDPTRVYSDVHLAYASSFVHVHRQSTEDHYARRDVYSPAPNVKTKAQALTRANRYLSDNSTDEQIIKTAIVVPRSQGNDVVAGQRIQVKFTHFDGYHDYVWCRVLNRTVREHSIPFLELAMDLAPDETQTVVSGNVFGTLGRCLAYDVAQRCWFEEVGDNPIAGDRPQPTVGLITPIQDLSSPFGPTWTYSGWLIGGTGTINVTFYTSTIGITPTSVTFAITKNGVAVTSFTQYNAVTGNGNDATVSITGLAVVPGDVIEATVVADPQGVPFFRSPRGTGDGAEALTITGGSLV